MSVSPQRLVVLAAALVVAIFAYHAVSGSHPQAQAATSPTSSGMPGFLRFQGTAGVAIRPDRAVIHFTTTGRGTTLLGATHKASDRMHRVMTAMQAGGVARINMSTDGAGGSKDDATGIFTATQSLTVTVMKVGDTGKLIVAGIRSGASANYGPEFSAASRNTAQTRSIRSAVANARRKADAAAAAAGLHVTGVVSVSESPQASYAYGNAIFGALSDAKSPAGYQVPIRRGSQQVTANVTVVFAYAGGS